MDLSKYKYIIGIDEVGCGCIAGPITVGYYIMDYETYTSIDRSIVKDSKMLKSQTAKNKALTYLEDKGIYRGTVSFPVVGTHLASLNRAYDLALIRVNTFINDQKIADHHCIVIMDGDIDVSLFSSFIEVHAEPKADVRYPVVSAASIIAKVRRDDHMIKQDAKYPGYGFAKNKGYPTPEHLEALKKLGPCEIHRKTTNPVKEYVKETA